MDRHTYIPYKGREITQFYYANVCVKVHDPVLAHWFIHIVWG